MPIHLTPPRPTRPYDGKGWNRLSLNGHIGTPLSQCALQPTSPATWMESLDTRRAQWGLFRPCVRNGACETCPVLAAPPIPIRVPEDRLLARLGHPDGHVYVVGDPERGWASGAMRFTWTELSRLSGWDFGGLHADEHGEGFWLRRAT